MGKKKATTLETTPDLAFVKSGLLNMIVYKDKEDPVAVQADSSAFLEDARLVKTSNMDHVIFNNKCTFKVTLDFLEPMECIPEIAVRESTDWILCTCSGQDAFFSKVEQRLVLQRCAVALQSNIQELVVPFVLVLFLDDDEWVVERVLR